MQLPSSTFNISVYSGALVPSNIDDVQGAQPGPRIQQIRLIGAFPCDVPSLGSSLVESKKALYDHLKRNLMLNLHPAFQTEGILNKHPLTARVLFESFFNYGVQSYALGGTLQMNFPAFCQKYLPEDLQSLPKDLQNDRDVYVWSRYKEMLDSSFNKGSLDACLEAYKEALGLSDTFPKPCLSHEEIKAKVDYKIVHLKSAYPTVDPKSMVGQIRAIVNANVSDPILREVYYGYAANLFEHRISVNRNRL